MADQIIITIVVVVVLGAHGWLFIWVKFKMDEGTIIKFLQQPDDYDSHCTEEISTNTNIPKKRVTSVCSKSQFIKRSSGKTDGWELIKK